MDTLFLRESIYDWLGLRLFQSFCRSRSRHRSRSGCVSKLWWSIWHICSWGKHSVHRKKLLHPLQKRYHMESGYDEDFVICPTLESIRTGNIPLPFRVNHDQFFPTHKLIWVPDEFDYPHSHYVLKGIKFIESGTEISFDYNYGSVVYKL